MPNLLRTVRNFAAGSMKAAAALIGAKARSDIPQTGGYDPNARRGGWMGQLWQKRPPFSIAWADLMRVDHQVRFGLSVGNGPLFGAEVEVDSPRPEVKQFVADQWERIWSTSADKALRDEHYGYLGFEVMYRYVYGRYEFDRLIDRHPVDTKPLVLRDKLVGINFHNLRNVGRGAKQLYGPQALWLSYDTENGSLFGTAILEAAFAPWYEKTMESGAIAFRKLRMVKDAWIGDQIYYDINSVIPTPAGDTYTAQQVATELMENRYSGGVMALPMMVDAQGQTTKLLEYVGPTAVSGATQIMEWVHDLDWDIFKGLLVPREVVEASETGSGYSGRKVPQTMFLSIRNQRFGAKVRQIKEQILVPLVAANFGADAADEFELNPVPLEKTSGVDEGGQVSEQQPGQPAAQQQPQGNGFMANRLQGNGQRPQQFSAADDVFQFAVVHAPHNMTVAGKQYRGGEFIPNEVLAKASPAEKQAIQRGLDVGGKKEKAERRELKPARRDDVQTVDAKGKTKKQARLVFQDGSQVPDWVPAGKIPGAWKNVQVATDPNSDVWATGVDEKGRTKTVYSDSYEMRQAAIKFSRNMELLRKAQEVSSQIQAARESDDPATRETAACMWLIEEQATRPGSDKDTKAKVKAFGATTLRAEHVVQSDDGVRLQFIGKKGVMQNHLIRNPALAKELLRRKVETMDGKLFGTDDAKLLKFAKTLDAHRFTPKDFRTLKATTLAIETIKTIPVPTTAKERQKAIIQVATIVSGVLGNKPQESLTTYINPFVFSVWNDVSSSIH